MSTEPKLTPELLAMARKMAPETVRSQSLDRKLAQVCLSHIYAVSPGWEVQELARAEGMTELVTSETLEAELRKETGHTLLVRHSACSSLEALRSLLESATVPYTVFYEYAE